MAERQFLWSDAWLLAAIFYAHRGEGGATLDHVIGCGDAINHAIFNPEELESGLARMVDADLLSEVRGSLVPHGEALSWFEEFGHVQVTNVGSIDWVAKRLGAETYRAGRDPRNNLRYPGFTRAAFDVAYRTYSDRVAEILRQVTLKGDAVE